jgi:hypothetical protein
MNITLENIPEKKVVVVKIIDTPYISHHIVLNYRDLHQLNLKHLHDMTDNVIGKLLPIQYCYQSSHLNIIYYHCCLIIVPFIREGGNYTIIKDTDTIKLFLGKLIKCKDYAEEWYNSLECYNKNTKETLFNVLITLTSLFLTLMYIYTFNLEYNLNNITNFIFPWLILKFVWAAYNPVVHYGIDDIIKKID